MTYEVRLRPAVQRTVDRLPPRFYAAIAEFLAGPRAENPHRVDKPLRAEFAGQYSSRVGVYRVIYEIDDVVRVVAVVRIAGRPDVYRSGPAAATSSTTSAMIAVSS